MPKAAKLYDAIGRTAGCRALATAFYAHVERDPVLRPLFPSTFKCAIEEFSAFLVQFLGGAAEDSQRRWWLSLRESHQRFAIGRRERDAWLQAMIATLDDQSATADPGIRRELVEFFRNSSTYVVNQGTPEPAPPLSGELAPLWAEQIALDEAMALIRLPGNAARCIELLENPLLQARFERSPALHASLLGVAAGSESPSLRGYVAGQIRTRPSLIKERYKHWRTLLHDASAAGNVALVEQLLDMGAGQIPEDSRAPSPLYCVANECNAPGARHIVHALLQRASTPVNAIYGAKRCTALHMAARRGNVDVIGALLDGGADMEVCDSAGDSPLRRAVNCNQLEAAKLLVARGANPHSKGSRGLTPALAARSDQMKKVFGDA